MREWAIHHQPGMREPLPRKAAHALMNWGAIHIYWVLLITSSDRSNTRLHRGDFPSKSLRAMFKSLVMVQQTPAPGDDKQFSFNFFFVVILYVAIFSSLKRYGKITTLIWHFGIQNWVLAKIHLCHREFVVLYSQYIKFWPSVIVLFLWNI